MRTISTAPLGTSRSMPAPRLCQYQIAFAAVAGRAGEPPPVARPDINRQEKPSMHSTAYDERTAGRQSQDPV